MTPTQAGSTPYLILYLWKAAISRAGYHQLLSYASLLLSSHLGSVLLVHHRMAPMGLLGLDPPPAHTAPSSDAQSSAFYYRLLHRGTDCLPTVLSMDADVAYLGGWQGWC